MKKKNQTQLRRPHWGAKSGSNGLRKPFNSLTFTEPAKGRGGNTNRSKKQKYQTFKNRLKKYKTKITNIATETIRISEAVASPSAPSKQRGLHPRVGRRGWFLFRGVSKGEGRHLNSQSFFGK